ncbi:MAG: hypothetical protein Kow0090_02050 [Myxococcota bacterium]
MYRLIIEDDEGNTTAVPIVRDEITIGRKEGNTIRLTERNISRYHAKLRRVNAQLIIEDLDSYTGIHVNGMRISGEVPVKSNDIIKIGDYYMTVREDTSISEEELLAKVAPPKSARPQSSPYEFKGYSNGEDEEDEELSEEIVRTPTDVIRLAQKRKEEAANGEQLEVKPLPPPYAKLIALTTEMAGESFTIETTPAILGSAKGSQIRIDHHSIAPRHIIFEYTGDRYYISPVDDKIPPPLVNGGVYESVALQGGDIVEIGQIKLRFVSPREKTTPQKKRKKLEKENTVSPVLQTLSNDMEEKKYPTTSKWFTFVNTFNDNKQYIIPSFAVGLILGIALSAIFTLLTQREPASVVGNEGVEGHTVALPSPSGKSALAHSSGRNDSRSPFEIADDVINEAQSLMNEGKYSNAAERLEDFMEKHGTHKAAERPKKLLAKINVELENKKLLDKGIEYVEAEEWDKAWDVLTQISPDSDFGGPAMEVLGDVKAHKVAEHISEAQDLRAKGKLKDALEEYKMALLYDERNEEALRAKVELEKQLTPASKKKPPKQKEPPAQKTAAKKEPPPAQKVEVAEELSPKDLVSQGDKLLLQNRLDEALQLYRKAIQKNPRFAQAYRSMGITYAKQGNARQAVKAYEKYLALSPNASDAEQVRALIRDYYKKNPQ